LSALVNYMERRKLIELCNKHGLADNDLFVKWFMKRFSNADSESYATQWIVNFRNGNPAMYMDKKSLEVYIDLQTDYYLKR